MNAVVGLALSVLAAGSVAAADYPTPGQGDFIARDVWKPELQQWPQTVPRRAM